MAADAPWLQAPSEVELREHRPPPISPQQVIQSCGHFINKIKPQCNVEITQTTIDTAFISQSSSVMSQNMYLLKTKVSK